MNLTEYRASTAEKQRTDDLMRLSPLSGKIALDIGARDGHFSLLLAERFDKVIALDLTLPEIDHAKVQCVQGNAASLEFDDNSIDFVFCAEVLEHIPTEILGQVCHEMERVCNGQILIGVPYRQDIRVGRTTCRACNGKNPPWGHVNRFNENQFAELFRECRIDSISFVGTSKVRTNGLSTKLMDLAGNPYGTYDQDEPCIHCGAELTPPTQRTFIEKVLTRLAFWTRSATELFARPRGNWIHVLMCKDGVVHQAE